MYEETLTGRPHDTSVQKATVAIKMWMQFTVMPRTGLNACIINNKAGLSPIRYRYICTLFVSWAHTLVLH